MKRIAIITGASTGLGREFVKIIKERPDIDEIWASLPLQSVRAG